MNLIKKNNLPWFLANIFIYLLMNIFIEKYNNPNIYLFIIIIFTILSSLSYYFWTLDKGLKDLELKSFWFTYLFVIGILFIISFFVKNWLESLINFFIHILGGLIFMISYSLIYLFKTKKK